MLEHRQDAALSTFVRDVAHAEEVAEGRRRRLAESWEFLPREVFMALQSKSASPYSCLTAGEIYTWLTQQSFCTSVFTVDDVAEAILPFADVHGELRYEGFLRMVLPSQASDEWLRDAIVRRGRFSSYVGELSSYKVPVEVMCRLTNLFDHEIDTTRQLHAHRRNLLELGVGPQTISDYFVEVTKALPRAEREALWCRSNLARVNFPRYWPGYAYSRALLTPRAFSLPSCVKPSLDTMKSNDLKDIPSPSGRSTRAPSVDVSPRSPKSPRSPALLGYPSSPTGSAGLSTVLRLPLTPRSSVGVGISSPRSLSPVSSPVRTSPVFSRAERDFDAEHSRDVNVVLQVMQRQGELDARVECAKGTISTSIPLEGVFKELDRSGKGYVTDSDLWHFVQELGGSTPLSSITALVSEMQLRLGRDRTLAPGHLSMRELCLLIFPSHSTEHELALGAFSDNDLVFKLHMQRRRLEESSVPNLARHQLQHLIDVAASAAAQLEADRRQLNVFPDDATVALHDAFSFVSEGRLFFSATDMRRAFLHHNITVSAKEMDLLWKRYQPLPFQSSARFSDFLRQLKPQKKS